MFACDVSGPSTSPPQLQQIVPQPPAIPHKSSKRNLHSATSSRSATGDFSQSSIMRSVEGLVRPLPRSKVSSFRSLDRGTRSVTKSSSGSFLSTSGRFKGGSPSQKGNNEVRKIACSATSALVTSTNFTGDAIDPTEAAGPLRTSRSKTKNLFAKFTGVLAGHFGPKRSRKYGKLDNTSVKSAGSDVSPKQIAHGIRLGKSAHPPLTNFNEHIVGTKLQSQCEAGNMQKQKIRSSIRGTITSSSMATKRLTIVDEVGIHSGPTMEDPFSESSSGQHTTEFEARLRSRQSDQDGASPMDPFQAENILGTSVDAILSTPPIGCSTPRYQSQSSTRCESPTQVSRDHSKDTSDLISLTPAKPPRRPKTLTLRESPYHANIGHRPKVSSHGGNRKPALGLQMSGSSDVTRLSSYPPGSTIRHVPRSMGRLKEVTSLPVSTTESLQVRRQPLTRKKHPSPSKGQLEMFGKHMEKNLSLGVYKDSDELGMSFNSPQASADTLSPRDTNQSMTRGLADGNINLNKDYTSPGDQTGLTKSRSRIPQPVRQLSRSRTDTVFARDFYPANKGDCSVDELQWDLSAYKTGQRCVQCGSMSRIVRN